MTVALLSDIFISVYMTLIMRILKIVKKYNHGCSSAGAYHNNWYIYFIIMTPAPFHSSKDDQALHQNSL